MIRWRAGAPVSAAHKRATFEEALDCAGDLIATGLTGRNVEIIDLDDGGSFDEERILELISERDSRDP